MMGPLMRRGFLRTGFGLCLAAVTLAFGVAPASADAVDRLSDDDRQAIRQTIQGQIDAFKADDADLAFSFATPMIQNRFGDPSRFVAMVKRGYMPVYRPRQIEFSELLDVRGQPTQHLVVTGPDNDLFSAYYLMEQQPDGSWRISGCVLRPLADRSI